VAAALAAVQMARHLTRPLDTLAAFARKLAARKFEERVELHTDDELAVLAHAMSNAAADLQASEARIAREVAIRTDLGRYLPAQVVERVVAREQAMALGGERRDVTIMFADIVGFTPMSAKLSPEAVVELLNELFTIMTEIVFRHGGTVDKFIGDCVMAFWGAPAVDPEHASKALEAARDMLRFLDIGNARWRKKLGIEIELAIGVHTGPAVIGNIGSEVRMEYTAIGETVNLAARLEGLARPRQILLSRATVDAADATDATFLSSHTLQGIPVPVDVFTLEP
jgi:class 3 adenylate cyclase